MSANKISRNDPCPCGSGKKFKNCCISKGIDWEVQQPSRPAKLLSVAPQPRAVPPPPALFLLGPFAVVDAKLKEIAKGSSKKEAVESLSTATPEGERIAAYRAIREAGILPHDVVGFLFAHAAQWLMLPDGTQEDDLDRHMVTMLRRFGADDLAEMYVSNRLEYDRRHERGRQFFYGPPPEELECRLREKGVID